MAACRYLQEGCWLPFKDIIAIDVKSLALRSVYLSAGRVGNTSPILYAS